MLERQQRFANPFQDRTFMQRYNLHFIFAFLLMCLTGCAPKYQEFQSVEEQMEGSEISYRPPPQPFFVAQARKPDFRIKTYESIKEKPYFIVIDPGHGGEDEGTSSPFQKGAHEKYANLTTAKILQTYLQQMGFETLLTRKRDEFISLPARSAMANQRNADLFISVHYNSAPAESAHGIEVFYYNSQDDKARTLLSKELAKDVLTNVIALTGAKSRGVKHGNLAVIRETKMPAILIEGGFFTNEAEFNKLKELSYIRKIAWGIAQGVKEYSERNP